MPNRNVEGNYRYGYQGQEKDPETGMEAFELRLWDARIGRWLTTDPYGQFHSPYLGMGNNPMNGIDGDGGCWDSKGNPCPNSFLGDVNGDWTFGKSGWHLTSLDGAADLGTIFNLKSAFASGVSIASLSFSGSQKSFLDGLDYDFYKNAPNGKYGVEYNGAKRYWSDRFRGGTRGNISGQAVANARANAKSAIRAGSGFRVLSSSASALSLGFTVYDASTNWDQATREQKILWGIDAGFGIAALTPAAPFASIYFIGKFALYQDPAVVAAFNARGPKSIIDTRQVKIDNLKINTVIHKGL